VSRLRDASTEQTARTRLARSAVLDRDDGTIFVSLQPDARWAGVTVGILDQVAPV
jgi:hypothetical protein